MDPLYINMNFFLLTLLFTNLLYYLLQGFSLKDITALSNFVHLQKVELPYNELTGNYLSTAHDIFRDELDQTPRLNHGKI